MAGTTCWPAVVVSAALTAVIYVGCSANKQEPAKTAASPPPAEPAKEKAKQAPVRPKLFADWPTMPVGAIVITGQMDGYLEPCGCTLGQQGGLGRRYSFLSRYRGEGWPMAVIDLGSLADPPGARGGPVESNVKFGVALRALTSMHYSAVALSADDLRLGVAEVLGQYVNQTGEPRIVAANVAPIAGFEAALRPSVRTNAGSIRLGVTAVLDPAAYKALNDPNKDLLTVNDPKESLPAVLADLEKDTNLQLLMVQGPPQLARDLAKAFPHFELVVATSEVADPDAEPVSLNDGKTWMIQVGKRGKFLGVVGMFRDEQHRFRYQRVNLNTEFTNAEPIRKLLDEEMQGEFKQLKIVEDYVKHDFVGGPSGARFIGAESCKGCHPNTYARWASTKHAIAYNALTKPERNREFDADCVTCHTTGFEYTSGYRSAELTPYLKGNQCENCHGPGSKHAQEPDNVEYRKLLSQAVANPEQNRLCFRCHDDDNSPEFNFTKYYPNIVHKKMDTYDNPKVHQGIQPNVASEPGRRSAE